jgi:hypothetical protein
MSRNNPSSKELKLSALERKLNSNQTVGFSELLNVILKQEVEHKERILTIVKQWIQHPRTSFSDADILKIVNPKIINYWSEEDIVNLLSFSFLHRKRNSITREHFFSGHLVQTVNNTNNQARLVAAFIEQNSLTFEQMQAVFDNVPWCNDEDVKLQIIKFLFVSEDFLLPKSSLANFLVSIGDEDKRMGLGVVLFLALCVQEDVKINQELPNFIRLACPDTSDGWQKNRHKIIKAAISKKFITGTDINLFSGLCNLLPLVELVMFESRKLVFDSSQFPQLNLSKEELLKGNFVKFEVLHNFFLSRGYDSKACDPLLAVIAQDVFGVDSNKLKDVNQNIIYQDHKDKLLSTKVLLQRLRDNFRDNVVQYIKDGLCEYIEINFPQHRQQSFSEENLSQLLVNVLGKCKNDSQKTDLAIYIVLGIGNKDGKLSSLIDKLPNHFKDYDLGRIIESTVGELRQPESPDPSPFQPFSPTIAPKTAINEK